MLCDNCVLALLLLECILPLYFCTLILAYTEAQRIYEGIFALCIYVAVTSLYPRDRGVTGWYQSLGSHIFSTNSRQINGKEICNRNTWVVVIQSNYKYKVIYSLLTDLPLNLESLPSFSIFSSRHPYTNLWYGQNGKIAARQMWFTLILFWHSLISVHRNCLILDSFWLRILLLYMRMHHED